MEKPGFIPKIALCSTPENFVMLSQIPGIEKIYVKVPVACFLLDIGKTSWIDGVKKGIYPEPVFKKCRDTYWDAAQINELIATRPDNQPSSA